MLPSLKKGDGARKTAAPVPLFRGAKELDEPVKSDSEGNSTGPGIQRVVIGTGRHIARSFVNGICIVDIIIMGMAVIIS